MVERLILLQIVLLACLMSFPTLIAFQYNPLTGYKGFSRGIAQTQTTFASRASKEFSLYSISTSNEDTLVKTTSVDQQVTVSVSDGLKNLLSGKGWKGKEFFTKESLAKLGLNVLLAYGFVSNFSYVTCVIISWVAHGRKYGKSPFAPGQWKYFLLIYSGLWAANNVIRPARFSLSLLISPAFEKLIKFFQDKLNLKKTTATALVVFVVNVIGTTSYLVFGLLTATRLAGVPLLP